MLVAADAAVMLIDAAKGVEEQTIKLFKVCRMRNIPIFTFVNKMDRASKDPFALMEELENVLGIRSCPMNWPIGVDGDFQGVYQRNTGHVLLYSGGNHGMSMADELSVPLDSPEAEKALEKHYRDRLRDEIELLDEAGDPFDKGAVLSGKLTPLFFGSAVTNFGVEPFLEAFLAITPPPLPREADIGLVEPTAPYFSGFIFKIQANMNPAHRDRLAFLRIVSGEFEKGMTVYHSGTDKPMQLKQPQQFMADERESVEKAYAGDIIGLFDPGCFRLGDSLSTGPKLHFASIPVFAPEHFARVRPEDSMKRKQFQKGIYQLAEEGAIQTFRRTETGREEFLVGVVGVLQFEVLEHRLKTEYGVTMLMDRLPFRYVRWVVKTPKAGGRPEADLYLGPRLRQRGPGRSSFRERMVHPSGAGKQRRSRACRNRQPSAGLKPCTPDCAALPRRGVGRHASWPGFYRRSATGLAARRSGRRNDG